MNMDEAEGQFILDSNVFIEAHRRYYGLDICPGFWAALKHHFEEGSLFSLDKVKDELEGEDGLWDWIKGNLPDEFFRSSGAVQTVSAFSELMVWAQNEEQYKAAAKVEFARVADGWLPAYSKAFSGTVVTHEEPALEAKKRIPLPNVCEEFGIPYVDTFAMLRALETQFHWHTPKE